MTAHRSALRAAAVLVVSSVAVVAFAQSGAKLPADIDAKSLARVPYLTRQYLGEAGQQLANTFLPKTNGQSTHTLTGPLACS